MERYKRCRNLATDSFQQVISAIEQADDKQIQEVFHAVMRRYRTFYPDWDVIYLAVPKNNMQEREESLDWITKLLRHEIPEAK